MCILPKPAEKVWIDQSATVVACHTYKLLFGVHAIVGAATSRPCGETCHSGIRSGESVQIANMVAFNLTRKICNVAGGW